MKLERERIKLGRKKEVRIRNHGETGDPDGRERAHRCERQRTKSREHANVRNGERKRLRERDLVQERDAPTEAKYGEVERE